jgi:hypothetical protein
VADELQPLLPMPQRVDQVISRLADQVHITLALTSDADDQVLVELAREADRQDELLMLVKLPPGIKSQMSERRAKVLTNLYHLIQDRKDRIDERSLVRTLAKVLGAVKDTLRQDLKLPPEQLDSTLAAIIDRFEKLDLVA